MPESQYVSDLQDKGKWSQRLEFSKATRKHLSAAAGHKCAIRGCLAPSTCVATKRDGTVGSVNVGRASHIYAAGQNGPRPAPPSMTTEQIRHQSNGIWTCSDCGDIVDRLECDYSPAQLQEMKKVRETAEKMAVSDPEIRSISRYLSPIEFDEVFWKNLPNLDPDEIRLALLKIAARELLRRCERSSREMSAPGRLPLKPLAGAIKTIIECDGDDAVAVRNKAAANTCPDNRLAADNHPAARRRAAEIVGAWAKSIPHLWNGKGLLLHSVNVLITVRHPQTKEMWESPIRVVGDGRGRHEHTSDEGEILHLELSRTANQVNNLSWQLKEFFDQRRKVTTSALRLTGRLAPSNVRSDFHSEQWEEEFDTYEQVVRKLADGWQPIGFVGLSSIHSKFDGGMHPEAFEIELQITTSQLDDCLYRCSKIRLARALEKQWGRRFECTEAYLERGLDPVMIQSASDELRARLGPPPYRHRGESVPLVSVGKRDIKLVARDGVITFISVPGRRR